MECNKDEAFKAKEVAENRMRSSNFAEGLKFAHKAQKLYPDLENISQMIVVCDVHCAAEKKLIGNEMDWYGILQIQQTADEATIKKQYRKFALQLHPDKNKYPGAESAFKMVGEAQRILLDKGKRSMFDLKVTGSVSRSAATYQPPQKPSWNSNIGTQNNFRSNYASFNVNCQMPQHSAQQCFSGEPTFWTSCPFCKMTYQYYRKVINKSLLCQSCQKPFTAYEMAQKASPVASNLNPPGFQPNKDVPGQSSYEVKPVFKENATAKNSKRMPSGKTGSTFEVKQVFKDNTTTVNSKRVSSVKRGRPSENGNKKNIPKRKRKLIVESSESCDGESSSDSEVEVVIGVNGNFQDGKNSGSSRDRYPRRSGRLKPQVSYKDNLSDDDELGDHPKRSRMNWSASVTGEADSSSKEVPKMPKTSSSAAAVNLEDDCFREGVPNEPMDIQKENGSAKGSGAQTDKEKESFETLVDLLSDSSPSSAEEPAMYEYPDPEFYNFDADRSMEKFKAGQFWSLYSDEDGLPRYYGLIMEVECYPVFKLRVRWLDCYFLPNDSVHWREKNMPMCCGKFRLKKGRPHEYTSVGPFSHQLKAKPASKKNEYYIFPAKGEIWALYRNWNAEMKPSDLKKCEYDLVEILDGDGSRIEVVLLEHVDGFKSVFKPQVKDSSTVTLKISLPELLRFSHQVPAFQLTNEKDGSLRGFWELDPAALPLHYLLR